MESSAQPRWFISRNDKRYGPFSDQRMMHYAATKKLLPNDSVSEQASSGWVAAQSLGWLFPAQREEAPASVPVAVAATLSDDIFDVRTPANEPQGPLSMKGIRVRPDFTLTYGDFQLLKKLGAGGMGAVYLALQRTKRRLVALKMLSNELAQRPSFVNRFYREASLLTTLDHGNIVRGFGVGEEAGIPFFTMEYVDGVSAAQLQRRIGKLDIGDALHIILHCAHGLGFGHSRDIIHRDVSPANILLTRSGKIKVADFGLAKPTNDEVSKDTQSDITLGTPKYMAPEQTLNAKNADGRSDIYSMGCTLYQLITGELPFRGETAMELLKAKETGRFTPVRRLNDQVSPRLNLLVDRMLAREPRHRPASCAELIREIEQLSLHHDRLGIRIDKLRNRVAEANEAEKFEILMIQPEVAEVRMTQEVLKQIRLPAHVYVAGTAQNAMNYLRREGTYAAAPRPQLVVAGRTVPLVAALSVIKEIQIQLLSRLPVAILANAPDTAWTFFQQHGVLDSVFVFRHEDQQLLADVLESARETCVTAVE